MSTPTAPPRLSRSPVAPEACHLARAIDLIGERWTLLVLRAALFGVRRFDDFQAELGAPRTVLSARLKRLTEAGLLEKCAYREPGKRARAEYVLTEKGAALRPVLIMLTQWGDAWLAGDEAPPIRFVDAATRAPAKAGFVGPDGRAVPEDRLRAKLKGMRAAGRP